MSAGGGEGANSPKVLTKPRPDIVFSTYTMKVLSPDKNYESVELEVHNKPDPYFSLNNPNDYKYRSKIKSVKLSDTVYAYGVYLSDLGRDTEQQKIARLVNKVFKNKKTKCIIYNNHLIFNKIPTIGIVIKSQESSVLDLIYSWDIYNVPNWNDNDKNANNYGTLIRVPYFSDIPLLSTILQPEVIKDKKLKTGLGIDNIRFIQSTNALTPYPTKLHDFNSLYIERELGNVSYYSIINLFAGSNKSSKFYNNSIHKPSKEDLDQFFTKYGMTDDVNRVNNYLNSDSDETGIGGLIGGAIIGLSTIMIPIIEEMVETKHIPVDIPIDINESDIVGLEEPTFEIDTSQSRTTKEISDADYPITILLNKNQSAYRTLHDAIDLNLQNVIRSSGDINYIFTALHRLPDTLRLKKPGSVGIIYSLEYDPSHGEKDILQYSKVDRIVGKFDNTHPISRSEIINLYKANESVFIVIQDGSYESIQIDLPEENILLQYKDAIDSGRLTDDKIRTLRADVEIQDMNHLRTLTAVVFGINLDPKYNTLNERVKASPAMYYINSRYIHRGMANETMPFPRDNDPIVGIFGRYEVNGEFKTISERFPSSGNRNIFHVELEPILRFVKETSRAELAKYTLDVAVVLDTNSTQFYNGVSTFVCDRTKEFVLNDDVIDGKKDICGDALILRNFDVRKNRLVITEFKLNNRLPNHGLFDTREITHSNDAVLGKRVAKYYRESGDNNINPGKIYYSGLTGLGFHYTQAYNLRGFYPLFSIGETLTLEEPYYDPKLAPFKRLNPTIRSQIMAGRSTFLSNRKYFSEVKSKPILSSIYLPNSGYKRRSYGDKYYEDTLESTVNRNLISSSDGVIHEAYATTSSEPGKLSPVHGTFDVYLSKALPVNERWFPDGMMYDFDGLPFNKEWFVVNLWNNKEKDELIETKRFPTRITKENIKDYNFALFRPILEGNYIEFDDGKTDNALKGNPLVRMKLDVESGVLDVNNTEHTTLKVKVHKSLRISKPWSVSAIALGVDLVEYKTSYRKINSIITRYLNRNNTSQLPITGLFSRANANSRYEPFLTPLSHLESEDYKVYTIDLKPIIEYVKKTPIDTLINQKLDLAVLSGLESEFAFNYISVSSLRGERSVDKGMVTSGINLMRHYDYRDTLVITKAPDDVIGTIPTKVRNDVNLDISYSGESTVTWATRSNLDHGNLTSGGGDRYRFGVYYGISGGYIMDNCGPEVRSNIASYNTFYNPLGDSGDLVKMQNLLGESSTIGDIRTVKISGTTIQGSHIYLAIEPLFRAYRVGLGFSEIEELDRNPNVDKYGFTIRVWKDKTKAELISTTVVPGVIGGTIKIGPLTNNNYIEFNPTNDIRADARSTIEDNAHRANNSIDSSPTPRPRDRDRLHVPEDSHGGL